MNFDNFQPFINLGFQHTLILNHPEFKCFGRNLEGQCNILESLADKVIDASLGYTHSLFLLDDQKTILYSGKDYYLQSQIPIFRDKFVFKVYSGILHSAILFTDKTFVLWGNNEKNQCVAPLYSQGKVLSIALGLKHTMLLLDGGYLICIGDNTFGQLEYPAYIQYHIKDITSGENHLGVVLLDGTFVCWGSDIFGQLYPLEEITEPVRLLKMGYNHTGALLENGRVMCWGNGRYGQCTIPDNLFNVIDISMGGTHSAALLASGSIELWGDNSFDQLILNRNLTQINTIIIPLDFSNNFFNLSQNSAQNPDSDSLKRPIQEYNTTKFTLDEISQRIVNLMKIKKINNDLISTIQNKIEKSIDKIDYITLNKWEDQINIQNLKNIFKENSIEIIRMIGYTNIFIWCKQTKTWGKPYSTSITDLIKIIDTSITGIDIELNKKINEKSVKLRLYKSEIELNFLKTDFDVSIIELMGLLFKWVRRNEKFPDLSLYAYPLNGVYETTISKKTSPPVNIFRVLPYKPSINYMKNTYNGMSTEDRQIIIRNFIK